MQAPALGNTLTVLFLLLLGVGNGDSVPTVEQDMQGLRRMTAWLFSEPTWGVSPRESCGMRDLSSYKRYRLDHRVPANLSNEQATAQTAALDRRVVAFLQARGWSRMEVGANHGEIPDPKRCYKKQGAIVQIYETTARCTMNTPCTAYDGFAVTFYLPQAQKLDYGWKTQSSETGHSIRAK